MRNVQVAAVQQRAKPVRCNRELGAYKPSIRANASKVSATRNHSYDVPLAQ